MEIDYTCRGEDTVKFVKTVKPVHMFDGCVYGLRRRGRPRRRRIQDMEEDLRIMVTVTRAQFLWSKEDRKESFGDKAQRDL